VVVLRCAALASPRCSAVTGKSLRTGLATTLSAYRRHRSRSGIRLRRTKALADRAGGAEVGLVHVDARRFIARLCTRFRVSLDFGRRLQPLVEKAARSEPEKRRLLLELVERSFAEEASRAESERRKGAPEDWRALSTVASVLHGWEPPAWFERWEDEPPRKFSS
jgi:hypothetical protein